MTVHWHEIECGGYEADLSLWDELADEASGPILDLGCGTGRVALHLAKRGHAVTGIDLEPKLIAALEDHAGGLAVDAGVGDARDFELGGEFGLILAPMQLVQLFANAAQRQRCLRCVARHLGAGGLAAFAIVEEMPAPVEAPPPLPDAREVGGWIFSSLPLETVADAERIVVRRLRQTVSPDGELSDDVDEVLLGVLSASALEREAEASGLRPVDRRAIEPTADHVGSTVVVLEKGS